MPGKQKLKNLFIDFGSEDCSFLCLILDAGHWCLPVQAVYNRCIPLQPITAVTNWRNAIPRFNKSRIKRFSTSE